MIKSTINPNSKEGDALANTVWPESGYQTVFLDWFNPESQNIWNGAMTHLYNNTNFDGLWLDMNEATGACNGECPDGPPSKDLFEKNPVDDEKFFYVDAPTAGGKFVNNTWHSSWSGQDELSTYFLPFIPGS